MKEMKFNLIKKLVGLVVILMATATFAQTTKYKTMIQ